MTRLKKAWRVGTQQCLYLAVKKQKERKKETLAAPGQSVL